MTDPSNASMATPTTGRQRRLFWWRDLVFIGSSLIGAHFYMQFARPFIDSDLELLLFSLGLLFCFLITTVIHEAGHVVASLAVRWKILEIVVWGIAFYPQSKSWRRVHSAVRAQRDYAGWVISVPKNSQTKLSHDVIVSLGGPLATLAAGMVCFGIFSIVNLTHSHMNLLLCFAVVFALDGITNLIPLDKNGHSRTDGKHLYDLIKSGNQNGPASGAEVVWRVDERLRRNQEVSKADLDELASLLEKPDQHTDYALSVMSWAFFRPDRLVEAKKALQISQRNQYGFYDDHKSILAFCLCIVDEDAPAAAKLLDQVSPIGRNSLHYYRARATTDYLAGRQENAETAIGDFRALAKSYGNEKDNDDEAVFDAILNHAPLPSFG